MAEWEETVVPESRTVKILVDETLTEGQEVGYLVGDESKKKTVPAGEEWDAFVEITVTRRTL